MDLLWSWLYYFRQLIDNILPISALIVAICALYIAIQSKREARIAAQVNLFYQIMSKYSSPEMGKALDIMRELFDTRRQNEAAFLKVVRKFQNEDRNLSALMSNVEVGTPCELFRHQYEETNDARRQVSNFFTSSFGLFTDFKVLGDFYFKKICGIDTFKLLYYVIEWLEFAFNTDYAKKTFTDLLEQSGRDDIEDLRRQRPPGTWTEIEQMMKPRRD